MDNEEMIRRLRVMAEWEDEENGNGEEIRFFLEVAAALKEKPLTKVGAAAPDLLAALKQTVAALEHWFPRHGDPEGADSAMMQQAREALVKAGA